MVSNSSSEGHSSRGSNAADSLTIKEYLETAADASRRTRFITIAMVVASVLVLVSVLNSSDAGWISLRLSALQHKTSYAVRKFPLLCKCDKEVDEQSEICKTVETQEDTKGSFLLINKIDSDLERTKSRKNNTSNDEVRAKLSESRKTICDDEILRLHMFTEAMVRSAAETKYTVHVPFFGVAFDINDVGILGGLGLWVLLVLLRLSLRSQIVSLRVGFKEAFACDKEEDFYQILAARQVFTFPPLSHEEQQVVPMQGWIEKWWRYSTIGKLYHKARVALSRPFTQIRRMIADYLSEEEQPKKSIGSQADYDGDEWKANRNIALRIVPQVLSLLPFFIYLIQFYNDIHSRHY